MIISPHFSRSEFACRCGCGRSTVDAELIAVLEAIRVHFNSPVTVTSGHRCLERNNQVGGMKGSMHLDGKAADIMVEDVDAGEVARVADELMPDHGGVGRYNTWTHIDVRDSKARWDETV